MFFKKYKSKRIKNIVEIFSMLIIIEILIAIGILFFIFNIPKGKSVPIVYIDTQSGIILFWEIILYSIGIIFITFIALIALYYIIGNKEKNHG